MFTCITGDRSSKREVFMRPCILYVKRLLLALVVCTLVLPGFALAQFDEIGALEREGDYFELQCSVMEVHPDQLVVCEKTIRLVDFRQGGQRYKTMLLDHKGNSLSFWSFRQNNWVFIRGFELENGQIFAREIYRLPRDVKQGERRYFPFFSQVPKWEVEP
jgi:hypothetical protein